MTRPLGELAPVRRGRFTAGTRVAWDNLPTWLVGLSILHNRACQGRQGAELALARHALGLAAELEHIQVATRTQLDQLLEALNGGIGAWSMGHPAVTHAKEVVKVAALTRDRHLRRLDGDAEIGHRRFWHVWLVTPDAVHRGDVPPTVLPCVTARLALHQYRASTADDRRVLVLVGMDDLKAFTCDAAVLTSVALTRPEVPWHQAWRPEVRRWFASLIERLRTENKHLNT